MHSRDRPGSLWIGWVLAVVMAGPAFAQEPQAAAGEHTDLLRGRPVQCASLTFLAAGHLPVALCAMDPAQAQTADPQQRPPEPENERPPRSSFLRWLHVDGLWVPTESGNPTYGLIGMHLAVARVGRFHVFGPPGVMLLRQRVGSTWMFRPAFTWGMSIYLVDFRVPGTTHVAELFGNLTRCWTTGDHRTGMSMAGLSVTWKR